MKIAVLYSGGKDSNYALFWAIHQGWDVKYLVTVFSESLESYMYQVAGVELTELQAKALEIAHVKVKTSGEKESELEPLKERLAQLDIDGIVTGALKSEYQRRRFDQICEEIGIKSFAPVWHKNSLKFLSEMLYEGYEIVIVGVFAYGIDESWLGRRLDGECLKDLLELQERYKINIDGEGGEFETVVLNGPCFKKRIVIEESGKIWSKESGILKIKRARLI